MNIRDYYPFRLVGARINGFPLDHLRTAQAVPATPADSDSIRRLMVAVVIDDFDRFFLDARPVEVNLLSAIPTNTRDERFEAMDRIWAGYGWTVYVYNAARHDYEKYNPAESDNYGGRR